MPGGVQGLEGKSRPGELVDLEQVEARRAADPPVRDEREAAGEQELDPAFAVRVAHSFAAQAMMRHLGAELGTVEPGRCEIALPLRAELTQQHGFLYAGAVAAVADSAAGYAAASPMPADAAVLTVERKVSLYGRAIRG
jgi:acyl-coenzyme A thioesterase PaaI-like protein